jgi:anti-sigma-K factor RskA
MNCADFRELAPLYALGALSPDEKAAADAHLQEPTHEGCFEALRAATSGTDALARSLLPVRPSEQVWHGIEARIGAGAGARPARMGTRERIAWLAAAVALLLFGASMVSRSRLARHDAMMSTSWLTANSAKEQCMKDLASAQGEAGQLRAAVALLQSPSSTVVSFRPQPGKQLQARAVIDLAQHKAMVLSAALPRHAGRDFELWILRGATPVPAGVLREGPGGALLASVDSSLLWEQVDALAVSLEPPGGSPNGKPTEVVAVSDPVKS